MKNTRFSSFFIQAGVLIFSFALLYRHTISALIRDWSADDNYSHGFLIPFITVCMIWQKKEKLSDTVPEPSNRGLLLILPGIALHIAGNIGAELFTMRFSIIILLWGLLLYLFGKSVFRELFIPVSYLIFMIPIPSILWNKLAFPLQLFAATLTAELIYGIGIPVLREGNVLHLASTSLEVVDACSGLRSLTSLLALSAAFAYISSLKNISKWILFFSAIPIAVAVNIIRLTVTAMMAHWIGAETAQGFLHDMSGMVVFIVAFVLLFAVSGLLTGAESYFSKSD
ncbi:MAG: exosortase A [Desulfococcaceae bacterium]|jgi:exosortase|nr:exosortase A [Desulfococcaceae bacterium]